MVCDHQFKKSKGLLNKNQSMQRIIKQWHTQSPHFFCDSPTFRQLIGAEGARLLRETLDR